LYHRALLTVTRTAGQTPRPARTADGKPDFSGIWQANNEAYWDLQAHQARAGMVTQPGVYPYEYARVAAAPVLALGAAAAFRDRSAWWKAMVRFLTSLKRPR
jgi:hypothetical protein